MIARAVFMGTPRSAIPTLELLVESHDVALVVTQPDRPVGRSKTPQPPPVKRRARELGVPVAQPSGRGELHAVIADLGPLALGVVVAYGRILGPEVLDLPANGILNVHFSLLPRWRGAAPVARALMAGDEMTGVSIIRLDEGLDTGPILTAQAVDILPGETAGQLTDRLAHLGAHLLASSIPPYLQGDLVPVTQSDEGLEYAQKLDSRDRPIKMSAHPEAVVARVRGLAPEPGATLVMDGQKHQILGAVTSDAHVPPGTWTVIDGDPVFGVAGGSVVITSIKPPGRNLQSGKDWVRGRRSDQGTVA